MSGYLTNTLLHRADNKIQDEVLSLYLSGLSLDNVRIALENKGIYFKNTTIYLFLKSKNVIRTPKESNKSYLKKNYCVVNKYSEDIKKRIITQYLAGNSINKILKNLNLSCSQWSIYRFLRFQSFLLRNHKQAINLYHANHLIQTNLNKDLGYLYGVICGDGCIDKKRYHTKLNVIDKDFVIAFRDTLKKYTSFNPPITIRKCSQPNRKPQWMVRFCSKEFVEVINNLSLKQIQSSSIDIKTAFLKGMYDSEASITITHRANRPETSKIYRIALYGCNYKLIKCCHTIINELGMKPTKINLCSCHAERYSNKKGYYYYNIGNKEGIRQYNKFVGFSIQRKQDRLNEIIKLIGEVT